MAAKTCPLCGGELVYYPEANRRVCPNAKCALSGNKAAATAKKIMAGMSDEASEAMALPPHSQRRKGTAKVLREKQSRIFALEADLKVARAIAVKDSARAERAEAAYCGGLAPSLMGTGEGISGCRRNPPCFVHEWAADVLRLKVHLAEAERLLELTWPFLGFKTTEGQSLESLCLDIRHHLSRSLLDARSGRTEG